MAETYAHQRPALPPKGAYEIAQCVNPGQPVVDAELAAGDQLDITFIGGLRQLAVQHPVNGQLALGQHLT